MTIDPLNKLHLSPEARAALRLPVKAQAVYLLSRDGEMFAKVDTVTGSRQHDAELAAFVAALLNAALTPDAAPTVTVEPESNVELRQAVAQ